MHLYEQNNIHNIQKLNQYIAKVYRDWGPATTFLTGKINNLDFGEGCKIWFKNILVDLLSMFNFEV